MINWILAINSWFWQLIRIIVPLDPFFKMPDAATEGLE